MTEKDLKWLRLCVVGAKIFANCTRRQYFAIILDPSGRVAGTGWNGAPPGMTNCTEGGCPHGKSDEPSGVHDNCVAVHAEENALLYSDRALREQGTLYINGTPCFGCAKKIAGSGLARIVCLADGRPDWEAARDFLARSSVVVEGIGNDYLWAVHDGKTG